MHTIGKIILIALGLFAVWFVYNALATRKVGGRQAAPYRPVTPDCRDPSYLRPFWVYPNRNC